MSSNQEQPNNNNGGEGGSNGHHQVPSWDEFNMLAHEEEEEEEDNGPDAAEEDGDEGSELLDADDDDDVEVNEPGHPEEFGPNLPPGFGGEDSQGENSQPAGNELLNDFSIPMVNYDLDDPEDPLQGSSSSFSQRPSMVGPQMPCANMLPRLGHNRTDEHLLPSIGSHTNQAPPGVPGPSVVDFIPADQPNQPSNGQQLAGSGHERVIGPALPPDLVPSTSSSGNGLSARHAEQARNAFPSMDELDDIGPAMPPDEPQQSSSNSASFHQQQPITKRRRSQERGHNIGPTLPSSSDEEEEEEDVEEAEEELEANGEGNDEEVVGAEEELLARNGLALGGVQAEEDDDEILIGPMPPAPGRSEDEEQAEYLARLAQFEANKRAKSASNGLKREQWMTEPPKKMLKTGPLAAPKTSFSRSTAAPATAADIAAWTSVPNANGSQKNASTAGPSTSAAAAAAAAVPKRTEQDEWEEQRANELNSDRNESLMDIHQKKRNQDANAPSGSLLYTNSGERRPFNRDADMEVRGLGGGSDPKALKERLGELSNRFGHSKEKKFL